MYYCFFLTKDYRHVDLELYGKSYMSISHRGVGSVVHVETSAQLCNPVSILWSVLQNLMLEGFGVRFIICNTKKNRHIFKYKLI